ncbi:MAG: hypothetical protein QOE26_1874 [Verrucomicrobiota bacterium]|jgi:hypothetical protein
MSKRLLQCSRAKPIARTNVHYLLSALFLRTDVQGSQRRFPALPTCSSWKREGVFASSGVAARRTRIDSHDKISDICSTNLGHLFLGRSLTPDAARGGRPVRTPRTCRDNAAKPQIEVAGRPLVPPEFAARPIKFPAEGNPTPLSIAKKRGARQPQIAQNFRLANIKILVRLTCQNTALHEGEREAVGLFAMIGTPSKGGQVFRQTVNAW